MKCQKCGENNANVSYTRIINGEKTELHLCSECAKEMNINVNFSFGLGDIFSNFFENFSKARSFAIPEFTGLRSLESGFDDFMNDSLFDNDVFIQPDFFFGGNKLLESSKDELDDVLAGIQKKHKNEKDNKQEEKCTKKEKTLEKKEDKIIDKKQNEINQLKAKIQEYIKLEEYEKAAVLRDKIKELGA